MRLSPNHQRLTIAALLLLWSVALIAYRIHLADDGLAKGLLWNLFLATVPLLWSSAFKSAIENRQFFLSAAFFVLWLSFFPNAPYLLTDLIHLGPRPYVPLWFLMVMLLSCAGTGTLLGYLSLSDIHSAIEQKFGRITGWMVVVLSLMLCGFGIYLGRFLRWNSWDAFSHPLRLGRSIMLRFVVPGTYPHPIFVTLIFGVGLLLGYLAVRVIATPPSSK